MLTKNINSVFFSKANLVFKMVLFLLILTILATVVGFAIIAPISKGVRADISEVGIGFKFGRYVEASITGNNVEIARQELVEAIYKIDDVIDAWPGEVVGTVIAFIFVMALFGIIYFMSYYSLSDILNHFMSSNSHYGFGANLIANARKSVIFALWYVLYTIGIYGLGFTISIALGLAIGRVSALFGLFVMYLLALGTLALRRALTAFWLPGMVTLGLNARDSFFKNFELLKGRFWKTFGAYFMLYMISFVLLILATFVTFGVATLFMFAAIWLYYEIRDMVCFYHVNGMKYYIDEQTVVNPKKLYKDAILDDDNFTL